MNPAEAMKGSPTGDHVFCGQCGLRRPSGTEPCSNCGLEEDGSIQNKPDWLTRAVSGFSKDDGGLMDGQHILVTARWILVGAGLLLALWNPEALGVLKVEIGLILALAVSNFFLHVQLLKKQPPQKWVAYLASAADIIAITSIVFVSGGASSGLFTFYFPALVAIAVAFPITASLTLSAGAMGLYALVIAAAMGGDGGPLLFVRLIMMVAVVICGVVYRGIERDRRREAGEAV